jgi:hypothetical protein
VREANADEIGCRIPRPVSPGPFCPSFGTLAVFAGVRHGVGFGLRVATKKARDLSTSVDPDETD